METNTRTKATEVEVPRGQALQFKQENILGAVPKVNIMPKDQKNRKNRKPYRPPRYRVGHEIFLTAFMKRYKGKYFVCRAEIEECPKPNSRRVYKVKITAVADASVGGDTTPAQASLLGRTITKRENEINREIPVFLQPRAWIEATPDGKAKGKGQA